MEESKKHHIFCNFFMRPREGCRQCEQLFKNSPYKEGENEFEAAERIIKEKYPSVIVVNNVKPT